eukprot:jgi/Astpho2/2692/fgenesh1_pg.00050_%23_12_t
MAHKGGLATRAYAIFEKHVLKRELCGVDVEGNKYYKMFDKNILDEARERRFMLTPTGLYDPAAVPPEWLQWLRKRRQDAPTQLEVDQMTRHREVVQQRSAALAEEEAKRKFRIASLGAEGSREAAGGPNMQRFVDQLTGKGFAGDADQVGDPPQSKSLEATGIMESNSTVGHRLIGNCSWPIFLRKDTAKEFQWRVRNLPHAPDVFSVTLEQPCRQIVVRTSNRKYFKRFTVPEMDHLHLPLEQSALSWRHNNNTLVISYQKPEAIKKLVCTDICSQEEGLPQSTRNQIVVWSWGKHV